MYRKGMRALPFVLTLVSLGLASAQSIVTIAGLPYSHRDAVDGKPALSAPLNYVYGILFDKVTGRLLIHDEGTLFRLEPDGTLLAMVGMGRRNDGTIADGTLSSGLYVVTLRGMAQDATGALYLADASAQRVYRVGLDGVVTTFAGGGPKPPGIQSDGGLATDAGLYSPRGLVFDSHGNLDIAEAICYCIRQVSPAGVISTIFTLPQQPGYFQYFEGLAIDSKDNLYATEYRGSAVWRIAADGSAAMIAGTGVPGFSGDGEPASAAQLNGPSGVTLGRDGSLYIADTMNHRVRRMAPDGTISTFAGTGVSGFSGDGGPATAAQLSFPAQTLFDSAGNLYVSDYGNSRVRVVSPAGIISTVAGNGLPDPPPFRYTQIGDGGPALDAILNVATSAAFGPSGDLYVADWLDSRIRKIAPDGTITTVAGTGLALNSGDGGPAIEAEIVHPITVVVDQSGTVYFETGDSRVRKITPDGIINLVAGTGTGTGLIRSGGDGGQAVNATLSEPKGLAIDAQGNVYIGDTSNARLRKVDTNGIITTIAGPGVLGTDYWNAVAFDPQGKLYVAITHTGILDGLYYSVIDRVNPDGTLTPVAGNLRTCGNPVTTAFNYDGVQALQAPLCVIVGLTFDAQGAMYIPESFYGAVLKVSLDGTIRRVVGSNTNNFLGDGGPPLLANLQGSGYYTPSSVAFDAHGDMFIPSGVRIREVIPGPVTAQLSQDRIDFQGASPRPQSIRVATNVAEPLPFAAQVKSSGAWLSTNRPTGQTGDLLTVSANPAGLAPGVYSGSIQISIPGGPTGATLAVTLTVP
jgi:sugar lactone lactonase YvrE